MFISYREADIKNVLKNMQRDQDSIFIDIMLEKRESLGTYKLEGWITSEDYIKFAHLPLKSGFVHDLARTFMEIFKNQGFEIDSGLGQIMGGGLISDLLDSPMGLIPAFDAKMDVIKDVLGNFFIVDLDIGNVEDVGTLANARVATFAIRGAK